MLVTTDQQHKVNCIMRQCFTSPPTQYRLYGRRFLQVKRPNQQYQSTEGRNCIMRKRTVCGSNHTVAFLSSDCESIITHLQLWSCNDRQPNNNNTLLGGPSVITRGTPRATESFVCRRLFVPCPYLENLARQSHSHQDE